MVIDIYSRYVLGWMLARAERAKLAEALLADSIAKQGVSPGQLTVHADRGDDAGVEPLGADGRVAQVDDRMAGGRSTAPQQHLHKRKPCRHPFHRCRPRQREAARAGRVLRARYRPGAVCFCHRTVPHAYPRPTLVMGPQLVCRRRLGARPPRAGWLGEPYAAPSAISATPSASSCSLPCRLLSSYGPTCLKPEGSN